MFRSKVEQYLSYALIVILAIMVINVIWQVFSRYVLGAPSSFTDELSRYLMIWVALLGAAYVSGKNMHVAIDVLTPKLKPAHQKKVRLLVLVLIILFAFFALVIGGFRLVYISYFLGQHSPALQIPLYLVYMAVPMCGILVIYFKINDIFKLK